MALRKTAFVEGEYYHIYNRGVDKRNIFSDEFDVQRFFQSMEEFNVVEPIGSIFENSFIKDVEDSQLGSSTPKLRLVNFIAYCLNQNHYHFILEQVSDKGTEKFMHRLGTGYTNYFNKNNKRSGSLFQGRFKAVHIDSNEQLLHVSAYVNLNDKVHQLGSSTPKLMKSRSSWGEYIGVGQASNFCEKDIILDQFRSSKEYQKFAESSLVDILKRKVATKDMVEDLLE
ncbi:MAG: transposase [Candidatus Paceibacterota bacterium]|jgi:REP element-mobilizing transposase RayT